MSASDHFHAPPVPEDPPVVDATYPDDSNQIPSLVLGTITTRIDRLWADVTDPVSPNAYEFRREFGEAYLG